jgi:hypothetical protein
MHGEPRMLLDEAARIQNELTGYGEARTWIACLKWRSRLHSHSVAAGRVHHGLGDGVVCDMAVIVIEMHGRGDTGL